MKRILRGRIYLVLALLAGTAIASALGSLRSANRQVAQTGRQADAIKRALDNIKLPPGFKISLHALVPGARAIAVGPQGKVIFAGTLGTEVYAVVASADPASAPKVIEFAGSIRKKYPHGVCFSKDGELFVIEQNRVLSFAAAETNYADPRIATKTIVDQGKLIPREDESSNHSARVCRIGPDGKLYITLGQPYNVPPREKMPGFNKWGIGGIIRMNQDGTGREVFARGIRNSVGMDFNPKDGTLWFTDNQADMMGDDIPPEELNRAPMPGLDFGFPWYGGGHVRTGEYKNDMPPEGLVFPQIETQAHAAGLGMIFYTGSQFPSEYRGGIFFAQHGSWNRTIPTGARVMFAPLKTDGSVDKAEIFAEGWLNKDGSYAGRPADAAQLPDGSLLVPDDSNGAIYMITHVPP
ncbi:MAG: PQQ-dependent sugar dehydrogenase [Beijerinckiaceae bacterium]|nr:PQQ-dependent sugar dehydrogenase [Beijerinckiaceae bacterium]